MCVLGALALCVNAVVKQRERATITEQWPAVTATVRRCDTYRYYPANNTGVNLSTSCTLEFTAGNRQYVSRIAPPPVRVGTYHWDAAQPQHRSVDVDLEAFILGCVRRHGPGSTVAVRYDPEHLPTPSVVGSGRPLDIDPVPGSWQGSVTLAVMAILVSLWLRWMRRAKRTEEIGQSTA